MNYKKLLAYIILLSLLTVSLFACQNNSSNNSPKPENDEPNQQENTPIVTVTPNYSYATMKEQVNKLDERYDNIDVTSIGKSVNNRKLFLLKLGNGDKKIIVTSGFHGRENITSLLTLKLLEEYAKHFDASQDIGNYDLHKLFNKVTFYFIPMLNPDGINIAIHGLSNQTNKDFYIKANEGNSEFKRWKANSRGVDLNKQFKADWEVVESKEEPHFESYKGPSPESEPESQALAQLTRKNKFAAAVSFHHSGSVIYWYYNQTGNQYDRDYQLAKKLSTKNGYELVDPEESDTRAAGYKDWFIKEFKKPGFTIEIGDGKVEGPLPPTKLIEYFEENREVLLELARNT
ncbi:M14 family metallopeptidase [Selenihalanaerobacter shriftii]|uniref:G-D-glutamyl-meso-diaminopimelate peptidase n=1 Tax=Selenihalanaerobacter shriftii TaxID=142842 RepID=A0A1T4KRP6_9FIRM|nr:M14 family metallocarboxypeptidase [Selenihalanaerobacter shriftii]SJZ45007.1 g-D-glutamyl-meso-diaminopimelate peptidase [Selenihalanaerobacter shriftii]